MSLKTGKPLLVDKGLNLHYLVPFLHEKNLALTTLRTGPAVLHRLGAGRLAADHAPRAAGSRRHDSFRYQGTRMRRASGAKGKDVLLRTRWFANQSPVFICRGGR